MGDDGGHGFRSPVHIIENGKHGFLTGWRWNQLQGNLIEYPQGAFRANQQAGQIIAGGAFYGFGPGLY